jgi:serine protease AprX
MVSFQSNYPHSHLMLLSTPERLAASLDFTGRGVVIAYLDSGFYMHPDIASRVLLHVDATTSDIKEEKAVTHTDVTSWHGLMVSAIGSGNGSASKGYYRGIASESNLLLIKTSNEKMQIKEADIQRGFNWLIENHKQYNVRIANVSVGGDFISNDPEHPLHKSVQRLVEEGVTVVIAAGNRGDRHVVPPASSPHAITVGGYNDNNSYDRAEWTAYHSNFGVAYDGSIKPDVIAPAHWIASPILPETEVARHAQWLGPLLHDMTDESLRNLMSHGFRDLNLPKPEGEDISQGLHNSLQQQIHAHKLIHKDYQHVDGTSVAAPIVTSIIAQMLEANPELSPEQIRDILKETAMPLESISPEQQGAGAVNAKGAVAMALGMKYW